MGITGTAAEVNSGVFKAHSRQRNGCFARRGDLIRSANDRYRISKRGETQYHIRGFFKVQGQASVVPENLEITPANVLALACRRIDLLESVELKERHRQS